MPHIGLKSSMNHLIAEPDGARLLICSEIVSEGRNFQFSHHLVLFDLPLNPELLEQRIGRLERIGQTADIIWIPIKGTLINFERFFLLASVM